MKILGIHIIEFQRETIWKNTQMCKNSFWFLHVFKNQMAVTEEKFLNKFTEFQLPFCKIQRCVSYVVNK